MGGMGDGILLMMPRRERTGIIEHFGDHRWREARMSPRKEDDQDEQRRQQQRRRRISSAVEIMSSRDMMPMVMMVDGSSGRVYDGEEGGRMLMWV